MLLRNPERRIWNVVGVEVDSIDVQHGRLGSGNIAQGQLRSDGYMLYVPLTEGIEYVANGSVVDPGSCVLIDPGGEFCISTKVAHDWAAVFIPLSYLQNHGLPSPSLGEDATCRVIRTNPPVTNQFRAIIKEVLGTAAASEQFESSEAARNAAQEMFGVATGIAQWHPVTAQTKGRPRISREKVIGLSREYLEQRSESSVRVSDLAKAVGVSERTLRTGFQEFYGMGPVRYLQLRHLHQVRRALKAADSRNKSVSQILIEHGEWAFSRFASRYRQLFDELPSKTLQTTYR